MRGLAPAFMRTGLGVIPAYTGNARGIASISKSFVNRENELKPTTGAPAKMHLKGVTYRGEKMEV